MGFICPELVSHRVHRRDTMQGNLQGWSSSAEMDVWRLVARLQLLVLGSPRPAHSGTNTDPQNRSSSILLACKNHNAKITFSQTKCSQKTKELPIPRGSAQCPYVPGTFVSVESQPLAPLPHLAHGDRCLAAPQRPPSCSQGARTPPSASTHRQLPSVSSPGTR